MNKEGIGFCYLRQIFARITDTKTFFLVYRYVINNKQFQNLLVGPEKITWKVFQDVIENFLGKQISAGRQTPYNIQDHEVQHVTEDLFCAFIPGLLT